MVDRKGQTAKINAEIDKRLKIRLAIFAKREQLKIWEVLEMALLPYLDERENGKEKP
jgi:hypothetical protein